MVLRVALSALSCGLPIPSSQFVSFLKQKQKGKERTYNKNPFLSSRSLSPNRVVIRSQPVASRVADWFVMMAFKDVPSHGLMFSLLLNRIPIENQSIDRSNACVLVCRDSPGTPG
jgi:hypothetical protein